MANLWMVGAAVLMGVLWQVEGRLPEEGAGDGAGDGAGVRAGQKLAASAGDGEIRWRTDLGLATVEAKRDERPLLVVFR